jgi:hypothetical protein
MLFSAWGSSFPDSMEIIFIAGRATLRPACAQRFLPLLVAIIAIKYSGGTDYFETAAFNIDGFAVNQCIGNRFACLLNYPTECCAGNTHLTTGILMGHSEPIRQPNGFALINSETNLLQIKHGNAPGLEVTDLRIKCDPATLLGSNHNNSFMRIFSKLKYNSPGCQAVCRYGFAFLSLLYGFSAAGGSQDPDIFNTIEFKSKVFSKNTDNLSSNRFTNLNQNGYLL